MAQASAMSERELTELDQAFDEETFSLSDFIKLWRQWFLDKMKPQNLPKGWRVDHLTLRTFGKRSVFYREEEDVQSVQR